MINVKKNTIEDDKKAILELETAILKDLVYIFENAKIHHAKLIQTFLEEINEYIELIFSPYIVLN